MKWSRPVHLLKLLRFSDIWCRIRLCEPTEVVEVYEEMGVYDEKKNKPPIHFLGYQGKCGKCGRLIERWIAEGDIWT